MKTLILCAFVLLTATAQAQQSVCTQSWLQQADLDCLASDAGDVARCQTAKSRLANTEMNRLLQALQGDLANPASLQSAQSGWDNYRAGECRYQSSTAACAADPTASACVMSVSRCETRLTCERVRQLREHLGNICTDCPARKSGT